MGDISIMYDRCISELHMSKEQSGKAMLIIVKELFNIEWKSFDQDATEVDLDTLPDTKRIIAMGKASNTRSVGYVSKSETCI